MPRLLIRSGFKGHQKYELSQGKILVGRGEDADLVFPNVSVSRHHARLEVGERISTLEDLGSQNGTFVNGDRIEARVDLKSGDELRVGKFNMVFLGDEKEDQFYRGRYTRYLPPYQAIVSANNDSTFAMTQDAMAALANQNALVEDARVVMAHNPRRFWFPEDQELTFGGSGMIDIEGWFAWGLVASVKWSGTRHVLRKKGLLTGVSVNGKAVSERPLRDGDRFRIGGTAFLYQTGE